MNRCALLFAVLSIFGQAPEENATQPEAEVVRVLAVQVRDIAGASPHVDPSLESIQALLEKVPGNHFTELGFHEFDAPYGEDTSVDLGEGYAFAIRPTELNERGGIVFECHIDSTDADATVEALRVSGQAIRGQGAAFRGLRLAEGELLVIMSIAKAEDESSGGTSKGSGPSSEGGKGAGGKGVPGKDGAGDGQMEEEKTEPVVPQLELRAEEDDQEEDVPSSEDIMVEGRESTPLSPDRATIEGILRALEEQDVAEQKSARGRRYDIVMKGDWW
jgi:hypothetical protein